MADPRMFKGIAILIQGRIIKKANNAIILNKPFIYIYTIYHDIETKILVVPYVACKRALLQEAQSPHYATTSFYCCYFRISLCAHVLKKPLLVESKCWHIKKYFRRVLSFGHIYRSSCT